MVNPVTEHTKKLRSKTAIDWTKTTVRFEAKLKPKTDTKYINLLKDLNQNTNIDKLKFLLDFYEKNK